MVHVIPDLDTFHNFLFTSWTCKSLFFFSDNGDDCDARSLSIICTFQLVFNSGRGNDSELKTKKNYIATLLLIH